MKLTEEFVKSSHQMVRIDLDEDDYKTPKVAYHCMQIAVKRSKCRVKVKLRDNEVYLVKE